MNDINISKVLNQEIQQHKPGHSSKKADPNQSFAGLLKDSIHEVNRLQGQADKAITDLAVGRAENMHSTLIAMEKAGLSFKLMMQVRNKIVEAYREVMRLQV